MAAASESPPTLFEDDDPWEIKKVLKSSDVNGLCRLLLPRKTDGKFIFANWDYRHVQRSGDGWLVEVREFETWKKHKLKFRKWESNNSYVFQGGWSKFVKAMNLQVGDEIGMFWNSEFSCLVFKLLKKHSETITEA